jgi:UDP-N-acetylglucosamine 2-epimerase (non-hydrolysing)
MRRRVLSIIGTRPEAIKMAPLLLGLSSSDRYESVVCGSGQHSELLREALAAFGLALDHDLEIMTANQTLSEVTARCLLKLEPLLARLKPNLVIVHGDTATTLAGALAAFHQRIPVAHVEAGLRSGDPLNPFPEEINRTLVDRIASYCFAPTEANRASLLAESIPAERIVVTGNTAIDALLWMQRRVSEPENEARIAGSHAVLAALEARDPLILVTAHRRESFDGGILSICRAVARLAERHTDWRFVYPVHPNPKVRGVAYDVLERCSNVHLVPPLGYEAFVFLMSRSWIILTDSGGIQEEAPSLRKPVLVLRERTERMEAVHAGTVQLVGIDTEAIVNAVERLSANPQDYETMRATENPYGDGQATARIIAHLDRSL